MTEEDEEFKRIETEIKRRSRKDDDDDIQTYVKPWVSLTDEEYQAILFEHDGGGLVLFYHLIETKLRKKNST
jgi:hypothetical protein